MAGADGWVAPTLGGDRMLPCSCLYAVATEDNSPTVASYVVSGIGFLGGGSCGGSTSAV